MRDGRSVDRARRVDRASHSLGVVAVDVRHHVPAVGLEALRRIVGEPAVHFAVDRDAVVVVEADQLAELQRAGERAGLVRDAFHEAAVAEEHLRVVIDDIEAGAVEGCREQHFSASAMPTAFARPWPSGPVVVSMPTSGSCSGWPAVRRTELPEVLQLIELQRIAREVQQRVQQHRPVAVRQHEAVAVRPERVRRGCASGSRATAPRRCRPCPSARPDGRSWPAGRHPSREHEWRWRAPGDSALRTPDKSKAAHCPIRWRHWEVCRTTGSPARPVRRPPVRVPSRDGYLDMTTDTCRFSRRTLYSPPL